MKFNIFLIAVLLSTCFGWSAPALNPLFTDHMVLQRGKPVPVYGTAEPGEAVTVEFAGQSKTAVTDFSNHWKIILDPMSASSKPRKLSVYTSAQNQQSAIIDVLVGDIWLCAGQSNMQTKMGFYPTLADELLTMTNSSIRLFKLKENGVGAPEPSDEIVIDSAFSKSWQVNCPLRQRVFCRLNIFCTTVATENQSADRIDFSESRRHTGSFMAPA